MANEVVASTSRKPGRASLVLAAALGALFLALAVRGVAWSEIRATFGRMRLWPFAVAVPLLSVSYLFRGLRWAILLGSEAPVQRAVALSASLVGYLANGFLPARAGEPIRAMLVSRNSAASLSGALATALVERLVDAAILTIVAVTAVASAPALPEWLRGGVWTIAAGAFGGLIFLFVAPRFEPVLTRLVKKLPLSPAWSERIGRWLHQFIGGLGALRSARRALPFLALTSLVWLLDSTVVVVMGRTVALGISLPLALALLSALGLASAAPSTPGYVGIYQLVAVSVLEPFGAARSQALVFIVAFQAAVYVVITLGGGAGLWWLSRRGASAERAEP